MIPKKMHFIWIGDKSLPDELNENISSFKELYDDYEIIVWDDRMILSSNLIPDTLFDEYVNNNFSNAYKADIARFCILYKNGGLYFDTDFKPLRRLNDSFLGFNFLGGIQNNGETAIGFIGCSKENFILKETIECITDSIIRAKIEGYYVNGEIYRITGPTYFNNITFKYRHMYDCFFFTKEYFYPYWFTEPHRRMENFKETSPLAYGVHHWKKSWA